MFYYLHLRLFNAALKRFDLKGYVILGLRKNLVDVHMANIAEKQNLSDGLLNFTGTRRSTFFVPTRFVGATKNLTTTKQTTTLVPLEIFQAKQALVYKVASEFYDGTDLSIMEPRQGSPPKEKNHYKKRNSLQIDIGKTHKTVYNLGQPIPPSDARHILLTSSFGRSGSSFLGEILSQYPGTFYSFEPEHVTYRTPKHVVKIPDIVQHIFKCKPEWGYFNYELYEILMAHFKPNFRFWNAVQSLKQPDNYTSIVQLYRVTCPIFPIRLIKTIFMPVHDVEKSLNDAEISKTLKVIILFRDPRGMLQSIYKIRTETTEWNLGKEQQERNDPARLCEKMKLDAEKAFALRNKYPGMDLLIAYV